MSSQIRVPKPVSEEEAVQFFQSVGLPDVAPTAQARPRDPNDMIQAAPYPPDVVDLYRIYQFILLNKRLTALEFGCGWSTLIIAHALDSNKKRFSQCTNHLRRQNLFEVHSVDNQEQFVKIARSRLEKRGLDNANFMVSEVEMTLFNGRLSHQYDSLPQVSPDFIYLDGPDQFHIKGSVRGLTSAHEDFVPMSSDILLMEHFLIPGTIILVDGRTANARFLRANLQRGWSYTSEKEYDQSLFVLEEEPLGEINRKQLEFYSS